MNIVVDGILFFFLLFLLYLSFSQGFLKVLTVVIGMYLGMQVAALAYKLFANLTTDQAKPGSATTNQIIWFFILWVVWSIIFSLVAWSFLGTIQLPKWARNFDQLLGLALGVFAAVFAILIISFVFKNTIIMMWYGSGAPDNWLKALKDGFEQSALIKLFNILKVVYLNILSPWLPSGDLPVFKDNLTGI
jgi:uncharacterized membrane protein required for colicin V production